MEAQRPNFYACTVTRQTEFAARTALGASRRRIVAQIFIEVLVLASVAAGVALVCAHLAVTFLRNSVNLSGDSFASANGAPFWMDFSLSFSTVVFAAGLAVFAATVAGALPALKATGGQMQQGLRVLSSGGSGMRLGATWTALVVVQVALSIAVLPATMEMGWGTIRNGILNVTLMAAVPGAEGWAHIEVDGVPVPEDGIFEGSNLVRFNQVDDAFLDAFDVPILIGRRFEAGDFDSKRAAVIVNQTFAQQLLGDGNPVGRRFRYLDALDGEPVGAKERWFEIVGVVPDLRATETHGTLCPSRSWAAGTSRASSPQQRC